MMAKPTTYHLLLAPELVKARKKLSSQLNALHWVRALIKSQRMKGDK
jgi:hypothetical protein